MQEIDTWNAAGWKDPDSFAHYVQAKMLMKSAMDAAHARGMMIRPVTNSILRLAQMPESVLNARLQANLPDGQIAQKAFERSKQKDALALLVRRLVKRSMRMSSQESQEVDGMENDPNNEDRNRYDSGVISQICMKKMNKSDLLYKGAQQHDDAMENDKPINWETAPYYMARNKHVAANHHHMVGITAHYIESLLLPGRHALRKDINAIMAFSSTPDGKDYIPVGLFVYGTANGLMESNRLKQNNQNLPEHAQRYENDFYHFLPKRQIDREQIAMQEPPNLFRGQVAGNNPVILKANQANQDSLQNHAVYYQQYQNAGVPANIKPSELQHRLYDERVAEIFVMCAQDPSFVAYEKEKFLAISALGPNATAAQKNNAANQIPRPEDNSSWSSLLMAFSLAFIATERISIGERQNKKWIPKYSAVIMELSHDVDLVEEAYKINGSSAEKLLRAKQAKRGTQELRKICKHMGFTSQPILKTEVALNVQDNIKIPNFAGARKPFRLHPDELVSLYMPGRDFFPLSFISQSLPKNIKAENSALLGAAISHAGNIGICPSSRGLGIVKCS
jgi:hypothetical protein